MRKLKHRLFLGLMAFCAFASCGVLALIVGSICLRGGPAISWSFFTEQIRLVGAEGGIFFNLIGTLILLITALAVCAPLALGVGLLCGVYWKHKSCRRHVINLLYQLNGVPSILFGILGMMVFVKFLGWGKSWLSGGILLGGMIFPTAAISLIERIDSVPEKYIEASAGLGLGLTQIIWSVIVPRSLNGLVTGLLLGPARAAGETAPIMFTATIFAGATVPHGIKESPVLSLPYHIFILAQDSFDPSVGTKLWGTALVMVGLAFGLSLAALPLRLRIHDEAHHD